MTDHPRERPVKRRGHQTRLDRALFFLSRALRRLAAGHVHLYRYYLVAQPVPRRPLLSSKRGRDIEVRRVDAGEAVLQQFPRPGDVLANRFRQGAVCYAAFRDNGLSGFLWFVPGNYEEDEVRCLYRPWPSGRGAWDFDVYVTPEDRVGLTFSRLWDTAYADMRSRGVTWSMSRISAFNQGSLAAHARLGARFLGSLTFLVIGRSQVMVGGRFPFVHIGFRVTSRPVVDVVAPAESVIDADNKKGEVASDA